MMWHEARKQEKKIRTLMVDYRKRADRRREFYEKIKLDPTQFLRVYGRPFKIHLDPAVALSAESPQSMMAWMGDQNVMIDRFDVRAHLDYIPEKKTVPDVLSEQEEEEERKCAYERYRILVQNECAGFTEEQCLQQIYVDEIYGSQEDRFKDKEEEKKKNADKKAAIGFTYEDSTPAAPADPAGEEAGEDDDDSIMSDDEVDLDAVFDIDKLTQEQTDALNQCGEDYGMLNTDFFDCLWQDKEEAEELRMAKIMEEEKAQFSGRKSRRERRAFKEKKLKEKFQSSPPSYAARSSPKYEPYRRSSSRSRSHSPDVPERTTFITSFGGSDDEDGVIQGPMLPPHLQPKSSPPKSKSSAPASPEKQKERRSPVSHRSRSRSRSRSRGRFAPVRARGRNMAGSRRRSRSNSRFRSRSPRKRSLSRSRSRSRGRYRRSRSRSMNRRRSRSRLSYTRRRGRFRSPTRSRSRSKGHDRTYRSHSRGVDSRSRGYDKSRSKSRGRSRTYSRSRSRSSRSSSRSRHSSSRSSCSGSPSPPKPVIKRYRRPSLESSDNSDSELSDADSRKGNSYSKGTDKRSVVSGKKDGSSSKMGSKVSAAEKLRKRMQAALNRQYKADKKKELDKIVKQEEERMDREEELRNMAIQLRRREREKRHKEREELEVFESTASKSRRSRRSRSRSSRSQSRSRQKRRSRSRSHPRAERHRSSNKTSSESPTKYPKLVDY